jgi:hypothetical protein
MILFKSRPHPTEAALTTQVLNEHPELQGLSVVADALAARWVA